MAYEKYSTDALVCGTYDRNTSDRSYLLFTREAGMVRAVATSVREERSKQRQALQDFSLLRVSLVPGKAGWRITGTEPDSNLFMATDRRVVRGALYNLVQFLRRFVGGEVAQKEIYDEVVHTLRSLTDVSEDAVSNLILLTRFRLLNYLGYIEPNPSFASLLTYETSERALAECTEGQIAAIAKAVDRAGLASHL